MGNLEGLIVDSGWWIVLMCLVAQESIHHPLSTINLYFSNPSTVMAT